MTSLLGKPIFDPLGAHGATTTTQSSQFPIQPPVPQDRRDTRVGQARRTGTLRGTSASNYIPEDISDEELTRQAGCPVDRDVVDGLLGECQAGNATGDSIQMSRVQISASPGIYNDDEAYGIQFDGKGAIDDPSHWRPLSEQFVGGLPREDQAAMVLGYYATHIFRGMKVEDAIERVGIINGNVVYVGNDGKVYNAGSSYIFPKLRFRLNYLPEVLYRAISYVASHSGDQMKDVMTALGAGFGSVGAATASGWTGPGAVAAGAAGAAGGGAAGKALSRLLRAGGTSLLIGDPGDFGFKDWNDLLVNVMGGGALEGTADVAAGKAGSWVWKKVGGVWQKIFVPAEEGAEAPRPGTREGNRARAQTAQASAADKIEDQLGGGNSTADLKSSGQDSVDAAMAQERANARDPGLWDSLDKESIDFEDGFQAWVNLKESGPLGSSASEVIRNAERFLLWNRNGGTISGRNLHSAYEILRDGVDKLTQSGDRKEARQVGEFLDLVSDFGRRKSRYFGDALDDYKGKMSEGDTARRGTERAASRDPQSHMFSFDQNADDIATQRQYMIDNGQEDGWYDLVASAVSEKLNKSRALTRTGIQLGTAISRTLGPREREILEAGLGSDRFKSFNDFLTSMDEISAIEGDGAAIEKAGKALAEDLGQKVVDIGLNATGVSGVSGWGRGIADLFRIFRSKADAYDKIAKIAIGAGGSDIFEHVAPSSPQAGLLAMFALLADEGWGALGHTGSRPSMRGTGNSQSPAAARNDNRRIWRDKQEDPAKGGVGSDGRWHRWPDKGGN